MIKKNKIYLMILLIFGVTMPARSTGASNLYLTEALTGGVYEANNIIADSNCVVKTGAHVILLARNSITLGPGFHTENGSTFYAMAAAGEGDDSDEDGLADWWEMVYFHTLDGEPHENDDGDEVTNYLEYKLRSNPIDENDQPGVGYHNKYDDLGRLKSTIYLSVGYTSIYEIQYEYDGIGNRVKKTIQMR